MIVGFTITDFRGCEKKAVEFIRKMCILESPDVAQNIVDAGPGVNIFSLAVTLTDLKEQPFLTTPIEVQDDRHLLISIVDFNIELLYNGDILRLVPTGYIDIAPDEAFQFKEYVRQGLVRIIPEVDFGSQWILDKGNWDDNGVWVDSDYWRDSNE